LRAIVAGIKSTNNTFPLSSGQQISNILSWTQREGKTIFVDVLYLSPFARVVASRGKDFKKRCVFKHLRALFSAASGLGFTFVSCGYLGKVK